MKKYNFITGNWEKYTDNDSIVIKKDNFVLTVYFLKKGESTYPVRRPLEGYEIVYHTIPKKSNACPFKTPAQLALSFNKLLKKQEKRSTV